MKPLANAFAVVMALFILGVLLLVSSSTSDGLQRSLDQHLITLREIGAAMQSEVVTADGLEIDVSGRFSALNLEFDAAQRGIRHHLQTLLPEEKGTARQSRELALGIFNSIDGSGREQATDAALQATFDRLQRDGLTLVGEVEGFTNSQSTYLGGRESLQMSAREVVGLLRQRGYEAAADVVFAGVQQALERVRRIGAADTASVENVARRIRQVSMPNERLRSQLVDLSDDISALIPARLDVSARLERITSSEFIGTAEDVREFVTNDYLFALKNIGDARVLLNVYTFLMLLNLGYFGVRLKRSHGVLNRSHGMLEERVKERTHELESAYDDLKESQVQLVQAEKMSSLGQLVAGVVHEINTPLLYVLNNTQMTHESMSELDSSLGVVKDLADCLKKEPLPRDDIKKLLEQIRTTLDMGALEEGIEEILTLTTDSTEGLNDIDALVKSLKDFSRLDRATYDRFDVRDGLEKTLLITKNLLKYGIDVVKDFKDIPEILCAPSRVNQVFINLITNAVQAMDGRGTLTVATGLDDDGFVFIGVGDTGCGIPEDQLGKVLDPFFTTKPVGEGTGLGLSIVRKIMDEHGGRLEIDSEEGVGTRITLVFPVDGVPQAPDVDEDSAAEAA
jgi:signal transduction histidine kinase